MPTILQTMAEGLTARKTSRGTFIDIKYFITGCEGQQPWQRLLNALNNTPNLPKEGEELASGVFVLDVAGEPFGESDAIVTCKCGPQPSSGGGQFVIPPGDQFQWEVGTLLEQGLTEFNRYQLKQKVIDRQPVVVPYKRPGATTPEKPQMVTFNILLPRSTLIGRKRVKTTIERLSEVSRRFSGATNRSPWRGGPIDAWLCMGITGTTTDNVWWDVAVTFAYDDVDFWSQTARWVDPLTGRPPELTKDDLPKQNGFGTGNGIVRYNIQKQDDFNAIRF